MNNIQLKGKTAVVTGSGRGLGKAIAKKLGEMGANIVLNDIATSDSVDATAEEFKALGINVIVTKGDVRKLEDNEAMINACIDKFGSVDILVNNAGITNDMPIIKMKEKDWDDVLDINLKGAFLCTKAAVKFMMKQRSGKII